MSGQAQAAGDTYVRVELGFPVDKGAQARQPPELPPRTGQQEILTQLQDAMAGWQLPEPEAVGHRIVHGGAHLGAHCLIDDAVLTQLEAATALAPVHMPPALALIGRARAQYPGLPQVACLDTSFHASLPPIASVLPLPRALRNEGLRRYGFHGLSCESIVQHFGAPWPPRAIIAHLGSGASITALRNGASVDTSMGLTPSGGLVMGTRSGDLDPGILIYLLRHKDYDAGSLEDLLDRQSGMFAISGGQADMRLLHAAAPHNPDARLAIGIFCQAVRKQIAAMVAVLEGVDLLVFTGGIGQNDAAVRATVCQGMAWAGLDIDPDRNRAAAVGGAVNQAEIGRPQSAARMIVQASREDEQIARCTARLAFLPP